MLRIAAREITEIKWGQPQRQGSPLFLWLVVPVDVLGGLAADPADELGDLGVGPHRLGCAVIRGKLFRCEDAVELAVADDVDGPGSAAAPRFRQPVMPVGSGAAGDGPAAHGTGLVFFRNACFHC